MVKKAIFGPLLYVVATIRFHFALHGPLNLSLYLYKTTLLKVAFSGHWVNIPFLRKIPKVHEPDNFLKTAASFHYDNSGVIRLYNLVVGAFFGHG